MRLIWWMGSVFGISLISIYLSSQHAIDPIENISLTVTAPIEESFRDIASPVNDIINGITDRGGLARENERLRADNEALKVQLAERQDIEQQLDELEQALEVKRSRPEDLLVAADVIAQDPGGFKRQIAINRGLSDGIDEGMAVLSENGSLIGTVSRAYQDFAWIRLVTDPDSVVNAQVNLTTIQPLDGVQPQVLTPETPASPTPTPAPNVSQDPSPTPTPPEPFVRGVAEGDLRNGIVLDLPSDAAVEQGDLVVTSGLGGNYPRALLIGTVASVNSQPQSPFTKTTLEPAADLEVLDTVLVLVSFRPARLEGP
ncbi:MAG: rod shape-determining protein MreC [Dehalococcoidia bacterium]